MFLIRKKAFARAGLVGNPSDGYGGKTISIPVRRFFAEVTLYEWDDLEIVFCEHDRYRFRSLDEFVDDVRLHGYYGGVRLIRATIRRFVDYCRAQGHSLHDQNFSIRYTTNVPRLVGLAGSSAIITATLRALAEFYRVEIPVEVLPSLSLSVETEELGIGAGLQDRVVQAYEQPVYMDFSPEREVELQGFKCGRYEPLPPEWFERVYVAYSVDASSPTEMVHNDLRHRFHQGDPKVLAAIERLAALTDEARAALEASDADRLAAVLNENFDVRRTICPIPPSQFRMVEVARSVGVSAKFAGSGGAIVGTYPNTLVYAELLEAMQSIGCKVVPV
ncbi:MAG: GHMP kinase [Planctomycetia bacterium]|jgi:glucuronokinase